MTHLQPYRPSDRRPIASRNFGWVQATARWLAHAGVSPNAISASSTVFAVMGAAAIVSTAQVGAFGGRALWAIAALCVQLRLLANLFDGMVALESGKASPVGELFNEVPDRLSDAALLIALGFVEGSSVHLGYAAALAAVFVAYLRAMGGVAGAGQVFDGIMAKPQRMFFVTLLCVFQALAPLAWSAALLSNRWGAPGLTLAWITLGCVITAFTRLRSIGHKLRSRA